MDQESGGAQFTLAELYKSPFAFNGKRWLYAVVFRQMNDCVALPFCPENELPDPDGINVVDMRSVYESVGRNLDKTQLTAVDAGPRSNDRPSTRMPVDDN